jgi:hypothetical protein
MRRVKMPAVFKRKSLKISFMLIIIVVFLIFLFSIFNVGKDVKNAEDFIKELKAKGYHVENIDIERTPRDFFLSYNGRANVIKVNEKYITYYEFETEDKAKAASQTISKHANMIETTFLSWGTSVKFYRKGNLIVQYEGTDFGVLWNLRTIMGKSVASSELPYLFFNKYIRKR